MDKKNTGKRWIAVLIAVVIFAISLVSNGITSSFEEEKASELFTDKINQFTKQTQKTIQGTNPEEKILVIDVNGMIADNPSSYISDGFNYDFFMKELDKIKDDSTIKAAIIRVNSPGGSVYISEQMRNKILEVKEETQIPIYTVMEEMAASGGYYISAPTDRIYASNETLTGSIGVIMSTYNLKGLFDKYGIKQENITSGKFKDLGAQGKEMTDEDRAILQNLINGAYERFVNVVAEGRNMKAEDVKKIADGRVYDGSQAVENGLVDKIGDINMAINDLTEELELTDPMVYSEESGLSSFASLFEKVGDNINKKSSSDLQILDKLMNDDNMPKPMYMYGE